jgi:hypothetical protein
MLQRGAISILLLQTASAYSLIMVNPGKSLRSIRAIFSAYSATIARFD